MECSWLKHLALVPLTGKKPLQLASNGAQLMCRTTEASDCNHFHRATSLSCKQQVQSIGTGKKGQQPALWTHFPHGHSLFFLSSFFVDRRNGAVFHAPKLAPRLSWRLITDSIMKFLTMLHSAVSFILCGLRLLNEIRQ